jgi:hypothetical protein
MLLALQSFVCSSELLAYVPVWLPFLSYSATSILRMARPFVSVMSVLPREASFVSVLLWLMDGHLHRKSCLQNHDHPYAKDLFGNRPSRKSNPISTPYPVLGGTIVKFPMGGAGP